MTGRLLCIEGARASRVMTYLPEAMAIGEGSAKPAFIGDSANPASNSAATRALSASGSMTSHSLPYFMMSMIVGCKQH